VRAEQDQHLVTIGGIELLQPLPHRLGHRRDEPVVDRPAVDDAPRERIPESRALGGAPELVQARAGRTAGELGILGKSHGALDPVLRHGAERVVALGRDVPEGDVEAVGRSLRREAVQPLDHPLALCPGVPEDRRASTDPFVQSADLGGAAAGDERPEPLLKGKLDDLAVCEELEQEWLDLVQGGRPTEVHHDDAGLDLAHLPNINAHGMSPASSAIFVSPATV
jgi:hypothetical protein